MGGLAVLDDIRLIAPGPQTVTGGQAQRFGAPGMNDFNYWIVAHYPIGISISGPFFVRDAPNVLDAANYVLIVWDATIGAESYDVLRTATAEFPQGSGFFAVATGLTETTTRDQGQELSFYVPPEPPQSPATCRIHLNNRDYAQPTLQMPCSIAVTNIIFADGTQLSTAAGGGGGQNQTPWLSNIDANRFTLNNAGAINVLEPVPNSESAIRLTGVNLATVYLTGGVAQWAITASAFAPNPGALQIVSPATAFPASRRLFISPAGNGCLGVLLTNPVYAVDVAGDVNCTGVFRQNGVALATAVQTPWLSDINGGSHNLTNALGITISGAGNTGLTLQRIDGSASSGALTYATTGHVVCTVGIRVGNGFYGNAAFGATQSGITVGSGRVDMIGDCNITGAYLVNGVPIGGGGSQTPWTSNIDGGNFSLSNCAGIGIGQGTPANSSYGINIEPTGTMTTGIVVSGPGVFDALSQINTNSAQWAGISLASDVGRTINIRMNGSGRSPNTAQIIYTGADLTLYATQSTEIGRFTQAGALLIGTTSLAAPAKFAVSITTGNGPVATFENTNSTGNGSIALYNNFRNSLLIGMGGSASGSTGLAGNAFIQSGNTIVIVGPQAQEAIRITYIPAISAAGVGINGVTTPAYPLDVNGDVNITGQYRINGAVVALAAQAEIEPLMTRIRSLEDEVTHLKNTERRRRK